MHIFGIPTAFRYYLVIWAIATVIGVPQDIDMQILRRNGIVHVQMDLMDAKLLPTKTDIVLGHSGYEVTFSLEELNFVVVDGPRLSTSERDFNEDEDYLLEDDPVGSQDKANKKGKYFFKL